jgi:antitoxin MazE
MRVQLTKWGNSLGLRVPKDMADQLRLTEGSAVDLRADGSGRIVMVPARRRYTLDQLLVECRPRARRSKTDREWLTAPRTGREII